MAIETEGSFKKKNLLLMQKPSEYRELFKFLFFFITTLFIQIKRGWGVSKIFLTPLSLKIRVLRAYINLVKYWQRVRPLGKD